MSVPGNHYGAGGLVAGFASLRCKPACNLRLTAAARGCPFSASWLVDPLMIRW
jgi:hypothetical protein